MLYIAEPNIEENTAVLASFANPLSENDCSNTNLNDDLCNEITLCQTIEKTRVKEVTLVHGIIRNRKSWFKPMFAGLAFI